MLSDGIAEFRFDLQGESVNKFNRATIEDFKAAIEAVKANNEVKGLIVTSAKSTFIVGAEHHRIWRKLRSRRTSHCRLGIACSRHLQCF